MEDEMLDLLKRVLEELATALDDQIVEYNREMPRTRTLFDEITARVEAEEKERAKAASEPRVWPGVQQFIDALNREGE